MVILVLCMYYYGILFNQVNFVDETLERRGRVGQVEVEVLPLVVELVPTPRLVQIEGYAEPTLNASEVLLPDLLQSFLGVLLLFIRHVLPVGRSGLVPVLDDELLQC